MTEIMPMKEASDIQSIFFEMWREGHPDAQLQNLPGNFVTASGAGLDPTPPWRNAVFQLERVTSKWAQDLKRDPAQPKQEIEAMLHEQSFSPGGGLFGEPIVDVLEINLTLRNRYGAPS